MDTKVISKILGEEKVVVADVKHSEFWESNNLLFHINDDFWDLCERVSKHLNLFQARQIDHC